MQACSNDIAVMNENVKLVQENRKLVAMLKREQRKVAEMEKLLKRYREAKLKGYEKRRDMSDAIRMLRIGAGLFVASTVIAYLVFELWEYLHGWA